MRNFRMKNKRTTEHKNGVSATTTFNKTTPLNLYRNTNSRLDKPDNGNCIVGCTNSGCKQCDKKTIEYLDSSCSIKTKIIEPSAISRMGAPYRAPIAGYRKTLICCSGIKHLVPTAPTNTIYGDSKHWAATTDISGNKTNCCRYDKRIRSGMQPKKTCSDKSCKNSCGDNAYSFSYSEYNKNRKLNTYDRGLEINQSTRDCFKACPDGMCQRSTFIKSSCINLDSSCNVNKTIWKPNNKTFKVQGAVSSGSRIDRLKLDTLRVANSKCKQNESCDNNNLGKGPYFGGKPRFDGWMFNSKHPETVCNTQYRQLPFGVPQLNSNNRPTRSNKMVNINLRQKNNGLGFMPRYNYSRAPGCGKCIQKICT